MLPGTVVAACDHWKIGSFGDHSCLPPLPSWLIFQAQFNMLMPGHFRSCTSTLVKGLVNQAQILLFTTRLLI